MTTDQLLVVGPSGIAQPWMTALAPTSEPDCIATWSIAANCAIAPVGVCGKPLGTCAGPVAAAAAIEEQDVTVLRGDVREELDTLPDASVDCVLTSPPYDKRATTACPRTDRRGSRRPIRRHSP